MVMLVREIMHHRQVVVLMELVNQMRATAPGPAPTWSPPRLVEPQPAESTGEARVASGSDYAEWRRWHDRSNASGT